MLTDLPFDANAGHPESSGYTCRFCLDTGKAQGGFCNCDWGQTLLDEARAAIQRVIDQSDNWDLDDEGYQTFRLCADVTCAECGERGRDVSLHAQPDGTWGIECVACFGELGVKR